MTKYGEKKPRQFADLYQTPEPVTDIVMASLGLSGRFWEPFAGQGKICRALQKRGFEVIASDVMDHGYPLDFQCDFFDVGKRWPIPQFDHVVSNPPYGPRNSLIVPIVERLLEIRPHHGVVALLLPAEFDSRRTATGIFRDCPYFRGKVKILGRIIWIEGTDQGGMENHAWFVWGRPGPAPTIDYGMLEQ